MFTLPSPLSYDALVDTGVFQKNHIETNASFDGLLFETFGDEFAFVQSVAMKTPDRVCTIIDGDGELYLSHGLQRVNRMGYFIATDDIPHFEDLIVDGDSPVAFNHIPVAQRPFKYLLALSGRHMNLVSPDAEFAAICGFLRAVFAQFTQEQNEQFFANESVREQFATGFSCEVEEVGSLCGDTTSGSIVPLLHAAFKHAVDSGEPDHQTGDVIEFLRVAYDLLTEDQRARFYSTTEVRHIAAIAHEESLLSFKF